MLAVYEQKLLFTEEMKNLRWKQVKCGWVAKRLRFYTLEEDGNEVYNILERNWDWMLKFCNLLSTSSEIQMDRELSEVSRKRDKGKCCCAIVLWPLAQKRRRGFYLLSSLPKNRPDGAFWLVGFVLLSENGESWLALLFASSFSTWLCKFQWSATFGDKSAMSSNWLRKTRPDTRPIPVADRWAGAEMRVFALSQLDHHGPTDRPTNQPTDGRTDKC